MNRRMCFVIWLCCASTLIAVSESSQTKPELSVSDGHSISLIEDLVRQKRWPEVAALAQTMTQAVPDSTTPFYWLGTARLQLHDSIGAVQALRSAQKRGLDNPLLHEELGLAYYDLNQFVLFEQEMEKAAQSDPKDFRPKYYLGLYHLTVRSDINGALAFLDQATQLKPDDWKSLYEEGNCFEKLGRSAEARQYYLRSITSVEGSGQPFGWPFQGMARLLLENDPHQALTFAQKAVEAEPNEYSNHLILAKVYQRLNNLPDAIREAREAVSKNQTDAPSRYCLFILYRQSGERISAQNELTAFQNLNAVYGPE
jgi:Flp pilus assembly protein TadD